MKQSAAIAHFRQLCCLGLDSQMVIPSVLEALHELIGSATNAFFWSAETGDITLYIGMERFVVLAMYGGNYGFSGEAVDALRRGPCTLDRPPAFFANTVEYPRRESLHHKVGCARVQGRGNRSSA